MTTATANAIYFTLNDDVEPGAVIDHDRDYTVALVELDEQDCVYAVLRQLTTEEMDALFDGLTPYDVDYSAVWLPDRDYFHRITLRDREEYGDDATYDAWVTA